MHGVALSGAGGRRSVVHDPRLGRRRDRPARYTVDLFPPGDDGPVPHDHPRRTRRKAVGLVDARRAGRAGPGECAVKWGPGPVSVGRPGPARRRDAPTDRRPTGAVFSATASGSRRRRPPERRTQRPGRSGSNDDRRRARRLVERALDPAVRLEEQRRRVHQHRPDPRLPVGRGSAGGRPYDGMVGHRRQRRRPGPRSRCSIANAEARGLRGPTTSARIPATPAPGQPGTCHLAVPDPDVETTHVDRVIRLGPPRGRRDAPDDRSSSAQREPSAA